MSQWTFMDAGVDEVGRGTLAGAVVAGAVILGPALGHRPFQDSKKLSAKKRETEYDLITQQAYAWSIGLASVVEIEALGILPATHLAMQRAVKALNRMPASVWIDGNSKPDLPYPSYTLIKGDQKIPAIAAASIIAKVVRDRLLVHYEDFYPGYGFSQHKGYGTRAHLDHLRSKGPSPIHRRTFAPISEWYSV